MNRRRPFQWSVWRTPILLAVLSFGGLISGLVGDGPWDVMSWIGLGVPVAVCIWHGGWRRR
jgi:hypothetical protein